MPSLNDLLGGLASGTGTINDKLMAAMTEGSAYRVGPGCQYETIAAALAAAGAQGGQREVFLMPGEHILTDSADIPFGVHLRGSGRSCTTVKRVNPEDDNAPSSYGLGLATGCGISDLKLKLTRDRIVVTECDTLTGWVAAAKATMTLDTVVKNPALVDNVGSIKFVLANDFAGGVVGTFTLPVPIVGTTGHGPVHLGAYLRSTGAVAASKVSMRLLAANQANYADFAYPAMAANRWYQTGTIATPTTTWTFVTLELRADAALAGTTIYLDRVRYVWNDGHPHKLLHALGTEITGDIFIENCDLECDDTILHAITNGSGAETVPADIRFNGCRLLTASHAIYANALVNVHLNGCDVEMATDALGGFGEAPKQIVLLGTSMRCRNTSFEMRLPIGYAGGICGLNLQADQEAEWGLLVFDGTESFEADDCRFVCRYADSAGATGVVLVTMGAVTPIFRHCSFDAYNAGSGFCSHFGDSVAAVLEGCTVAQANILAPNAATLTIRGIAALPAG
jgi:hypothetical protein